MLFVKQFLDGIGYGAAQPDSLHEHQHLFCRKPTLHLLHAPAAEFLKERIRVVLYLGLGYKLFEQGYGDVHPSKRLVSG